MFLDSCKENDQSCEINFSESERFEIILWGLRPTSQISALIFQLFELSETNGVRVISENTQSESAQ